MRPRRRWRAAAAAALALRPTVAAAAAPAVGRLCVAGLSVRLVTARRWEFLEGIVTSVSEGPRLVTRDARTARRAGWEEMLGGRGAATATRRKEQTCTT